MGGVNVELIFLANPPNRKEASRFRNVGLQSVSLYREGFLFSLFRNQTINRETVYRQKVNSLYILSHYGRE